MRANDFILNKLTFSKNNKLSLFVVPIWAFSVLFGYIISPAHATSIEDFSRHSEFHNVKISPDGKHLAVLVNTDGRKTLAFLDSRTFEVAFGLGGKEGDPVADYLWVKRPANLISTMKQNSASR